MILLCASDQTLHTKKKRKFVLSHSIHKSFWKSNINTEGRSYIWISPPPQKTKNKNAAVYEIVSMCQ